MAIDGVGGTATGYGSSGFGFGNTQEIQDQFMQILLTQLRYQDPMEPLKEQEFLAQLAQFSSATQIGELNKTVGTAVQYMVASQANQSLLSAANLIGKTFQAEVEEGRIEGVVQSVCFDQGMLMVKSGDDLIPIECLVFIGGEPQEPAEGQVEENADQGS